MVDGGVGGDLLGSHVLRCPEGNAELGERVVGVRGARGGDRFADAEIGDRRAVAGKKNVVGLDVAVDNALVVRELERAGDVAEDVHDVADAHRACTHEAHAKRLALDKGHRVEGQAIHLAGAEDGDDVRMLQPRRELDLAAEAFDVDASGEIGREHLHDDASSQRAFLGDEHTTHPAAGELPLDGVGVGEDSLEVVAELGRHGFECVAPARSSRLPPQLS